MVDEAQMREAFKLAALEWATACMMKRPLDECDAALDFAWGIAKQSATDQYKPLVEWQPIETAPKDGTVFLALHEQRYTADQLQGESEGWLHLPRLPFLCRWVADFLEDEPPEEGGSFVKVNECNLYERFNDVEPSHWQPLHDTPQALARFPQLEEKK